MMDLTYVLCFIGCDDSQSSFEIYEKIEKMHEFWTIWLNKLSIAFLLLLFGGSALFPISYAIFEYPVPHSWTVIIEMQ